MTTNKYLFLKRLILSFECEHFIQNIAKHILQLLNMKIIMKVATIIIEFNIFFFIICFLFYIIFYIIFFFFICYSCSVEERIFTSNKNRAKTFFYYLFFNESINFMYFGSINCTLSKDAIFATS